MLINRNKGAAQDGDPKDSQFPKTDVSGLPPEVAEVLAAPTGTGPAPAPAPAGPIDQTVLLMALIEKLGKSIELQTEVAQRAGRKDLEEEIKLQTKRDQYARNRGDETQAVLNKQANCDHLKGGKFRNRGSAEDFAVYFHRFIDNTMYIKCMLCKMKWYPTDTADIIFRGGEARVNHTHIGWLEAAKMCFKKSTNQLSSSEIPAETQMRVQKKEDVPDTLGVITR